MWIDDLSLAWRSSWRSLRSRPGFAAAAVLTLALVIGAGTAIFCIVEAVLLRPLAYDAPQELVKIGGLQSVPDVSDLARQSDAFAAVGMFQPKFYDLTLNGRPDRLAAAVVSAELFDVLRAKPLAGRLFGPADDRPDGAKVVLVREGAWRRRFGRDPRIIGRSLRLSGSVYKVLGILPDDLPAPNDQRVEIWLPLGVEAPWAREDRGAQVVEAYARLKPGLPLAGVRQGLATIRGRLAQTYPESNVDRDFTPTPITQAIVGDVERLLLLLLGAAGIVVLIACANLANLQLARAVEREKEMALRTALGAGRARLVGQILLESLILALLGGAAGLLLAFWGSTAFASLAGDRIPRLEEVGLTPRTVAFTAGLALLCALLSGLPPAWLAGRANLQGSLQGRGAAAGRGMGGARLRTALVLCEVTVCFVLLFSSGLLIRSFYRLTQVAPGFTPAGTLTFDLALPEARYYPIEPQTAFFRKALDQVRTVPGVTAAGAVSELPLGTSALDMPLVIEGQPAPRKGQEPKVFPRVIDDGYFPALKIRLLAGRNFTPQDREGSPYVAIVNASMARRHWPGENPVGKRIQWIYGNEPQPWMTVVGVVADVKQFGLDRQDGPALYTPYAQKLREWQRAMTFVVRTDLSPIALAPALQRAVWTVDPDLPVTEIKTMEQRLSASVAPRRLVMALLAVFAGLSLLLVAVGIYGVVSYLTRQRTREIGVRLALGARPGGVVWMIVGEGLLRLVPASLAGLALAWVSTRWLASLLYETGRFDLGTCLAVLLLLLGIATATWFLSARRAAQVDPVTALRAE